MTPESAVTLPEIGSPMPLADGSEWLGREYALPFESRKTASWLLFPRQKSWSLSSPRYDKELGSISCPFALLIHPASERTTVIDSVTSVSSSENTFASEDSFIGDFLSSPNSSFISSNSFLIRVLSLVLEFNIFSISSLSSTNESLSCSSLICSSFASCLNLISRIALAWISDSLKAFIISFLGSSDSLMIFITLSRSK